MDATLYLEWDTFINVTFFSVILGKMSNSNVFWMWHFCKCDTFLVQYCVKVTFFLFDTFFISDTFSNRILFRMWLWISKTMLALQQIRYSFDPLDRVLSLILYVFNSIKASMSNSNHCAGCTLSCKARKAYSGPPAGRQFDKFVRI